LTATGTGGSTEEGARATSYGQRRLWFADQIGRQGLEFVYPYGLRLRGTLDRQALQSAFDVLVARHESLRTTYRLVDNEPYQFVQPAAPVPVAFRELTPQALDTGLSEVLRADLERPFDLTTGPLFRVGVYRIGPDDHVLLVAVHHIATDGWSMDIFFRDLAELYNARREGRPADLPPLALQYADFSDWQRQSARSDAVRAELAYWRDRLAGAPLVVDLPTDRPRPDSQSYRGGCVSFAVPPHLVRGLDAVARDASASRFMALLAVLHLTLARWSGQSDFIIGTPLAHRPLRESEHMIGFFVNLLPFRLRTDERCSFRELLAHTREVALDAYDNQTVSFERVVEEVAPARTLAHNPVIQVTLTDETSVPPVLTGMDTETLEVRLDITRYDLAFDYRPARGGGLAVDLYFAADLFDRATAERVARQFVRAIETSVAAPDRPLYEAPLTEEEPGWPAPDRATAPPLVANLARVVAAEPGRLAVAAGTRQLTFGELDRESRRLAAVLRGQGVRRGDLVGVCLPADVDLVVALVAVWRAGAAFVPLDPGYPETRLHFLVADSRTSAVLTWSGCPVRWPDRLAVVRLDDTAEGASPTDDGVTDAVDGGDLAYVIYTSGSTGQPKGVAVTHGAVATLFRGLEAAGCLAHVPARVGWNASVSFDASVQQWARIFRGDSIVVLTAPERRDPELFAAALARWEVTDVDVTPSHLDVLQTVLPKALQGRTPLRLFVGGEAIPPALWSTLRAWQAAGLATALNLYGPTECTVDATVARVGDHERPAIGHPLAGVSAYVLDPWWRAVPDGTVGELFLGGGQVALGYLDRPGLTAHSFVPDIFANDGSRMYRTGDRVRRVDGVLEYRGRKDFQVKVRGYRIELGEVESVLATIPGVRSAVAVVVGDGQTLAAAYTHAPGTTVEQVRTHAAALLPAYLVPTVLRPVDALPLTPNGKVDRAALTERLATRPDTGADATLNGPIEKLIASVWTEILGVESVSPHDSFFSLGGHSLLAIRLVARVKQTLSLRLPIAAVFEHATLRDLAAHIGDLIRRELAGRSAN
jgi:amino acid adenylation domain-containing protein